MGRRKPKWRGITKNRTINEGMVRQENIPEMTGKSDKMTRSKTDQFIIFMNIVVVL